MCGGFGCFFIGYCIVAGSGGFGVGCLFCVDLVFVCAFVDLICWLLWVVLCGVCLDVVIVLGFGFVFIWLGLGVWLGLFTLLWCFVYW